MSPLVGAGDLVAAARGLAADVAEFASFRKAAQPATAPLVDDDYLAEYDRRIQDPDLRVATRSRFVAEHYADAVEAGVKALNECIRSRTGLTEDGDGLMTAAFSPKAPLLRINAGRSRSDESEQRGHMMLCQGVVGAWRNPRAHKLLSDSPARTLMMLATVESLITTTKEATRTRKRTK